MIEKINFKIISSKILLFLVVAVIVAMLPPFSVYFLWFSLSIAFITIFSMVYSIKQRNAALYLLYYLGTNTFLFLLGLRLWDIIIGISYKLVISLIPGLLLAALFPFINRDVSESLYRAESSPNLKSFLMLSAVGAANVIVLTFLWKILGVEIFEKGLLTPKIAIMGSIMYIVTLGILHSGFHMFISGRFQDLLDRS